MTRQRPEPAERRRGPGVLGKHLWTDDERETLKLRYQRGDAPKDIAGYFGVSWRAVLSQAHKLGILHGSKSQTIRARFQRYQSRARPDTDCVLWTGYRNAKGYGVLNVDGRSRLATHVMLGLAGIAVPADRIVCHACDNPGCVNIDHLFVGTQFDNMNDARMKGRLCQTPAERRFCYIPPDECFHGHALTGDNLVYTRGHRVCRTCRNEQARQFRARRAA